MGLAAGASNRALALGAGLAAFGGKALMVGLVAGVAPFVGQFVHDFVEQSLINFEFTPEVASSFGDAAGLASLGGILGLAFGKRFGLIAGAAGAAYTFGDEVLDYLGIDPKSMVSVFGQEFQAQNVMGGVMSAMIGIAGFALTSPGMWTRMAGLATASTSFVLSLLKTRLGVASAIGTLYMMYGDQASAWLQEFGLSEGESNLIVDGVSFATMGAFLGSKFGPVGLIVGGLAGLALGIGKGIFDWVQKEKQQRIDEVINSAKEALDGAGGHDKAAEALEKDPNNSAAAASSSSIQDELVKNGADPTSLSEEDKSLIEEGKKLDKAVVTGLTLKGIENTDDAAKLISSAVISDSDVAAAADLLRQYGPWGQNGDENYLTPFIETLMRKYPQLGRLSEDEFLEALGKTNAYILDNNSISGAGYAINWGPVFPTKGDFAGDAVLEGYNSVKKMNLDVNEGLSPKTNDVVDAGEQKQSNTNNVVVNAPTNNTSVVHGGTNAAATTVVGGGGGGGRDSTFHHLPVY